MVMLASLCVQAVSGLFTTDEIDEEGPFVANVSERTVKLMTRIHHWNENVLLTLVGLHVLAIALYLIVRHDNLIAPMLTGRGESGDRGPLRFASPWLALALAAACAVAVTVLVRSAG
jgi:cytochrome b